MKVMPWVMKVARDDEPATPDMIAIAEAELDSEFLFA